MAYFANLGSTIADFNQMIQRFGVVTVMNADVYDANDFDFENHTVYDILKQAEGLTSICHLDTLKIANVTIDGPTKTVSGGQYSNPLIKFGKSGRLEMQDALGNANAVEALCGGIVERKDSINGDIVSLHVGEDFAGAKTIIGDSFFIDQKTGAQVKVKVVFYQFLPDSLFNLTQDSEGDATVFDMNGDLLTTEIKVGTEDGSGISHGVFYSIVDPKEEKAGKSIYSINNNKITLGEGYTATLNGSTVISNTTTLEKDKAYLLIVSKEEKEVLRTIVTGA